MENPYAPSTAPPEPPKDGGKPRPIWRGLLLAYSVHHMLGALGFVAGYLYMSSDWSKLFLLERAWWEIPMVLLATPMLDFYLLIEPLLVGEVVPPTMIGLRWLRSAFVLTIPVAVIAFSVSRNRGLLWYVGLVSFLLCMSLPLSQAMDRKHRSVSARHAPGPGLVPAVGSKHQEPQLQPNRRGEVDGVDWHGGNSWFRVSDTQALELRAS